LPLSPVRDVACWIEDERYCIDVLTQLRAVRADFGKVEQEILHDHLRHCVADALHGGSPKERQTKIEELLEVLDKQR
jgi:DNA-binding FrmR family transcriptional regulator